MTDRKEYKIEINDTTTLIKSKERNYIIWNGLEINWFIGDLNQVCYTNNFEDVWEAWGSFNGHPYQLSAWYNMEKNELYNIEICAVPNTEHYRHYYHKETYEMIQNAILNNKNQLPPS